MEFNQLRYFVAVADSSNFTRAAEQCLVSQPSLSQQISKLEQEVGKALFDRLGRKVRLTNAGNALYDKAIAVLAAVDDAKSCVEIDSDWRAGSLSIAAIPTIAPYVLPPLLKGFQKRYPKAQLTVRESFTDEVVKDCIAGEADLGIVALPIEDERLTVETLFSEELLLAMPRGHRLAKKKTITLNDLAKEDFVLLSDIHCLGEHIVAFCRQHEFLPSITCRTAQLLTVQELVGLKQGISLVPRMAVLADKNKARHYRSLTSNKPARTIAMIRNKWRFQGPLTREFVKNVRAFHLD